MLLNVVQSLMDGDVSVEKANLAKAKLAKMINSTQKFLKLSVVVSDIVMTIDFAVPMEPLLMGMLQNYPTLLVFLVVCDVLCP